MLLLIGTMRTQVGKVETFGHQYAFARAPIWWRGQVSDNCVGLGVGQGVGQGVGGDLVAGTGQW